MTDPTSRQRGRPTKTKQQLLDNNIRTESNIWSQVPEWARQLDIRADWLSVVTWLRLRLGLTVVVYCENHMKHIHCAGRMPSFSMLKQVVHTGTTEIQRVNAYFSKTQMKQFSFWKMLQTQQSVQLVTSVTDVWELRRCLHGRGQDCSSRAVRKPAYRLMFKPFKTIFFLSR
jgi:hypothetical protein